MLNILTEPLMRMTTPKGSPKSSLPEIYAALMADQVESFPALRSHQRHAWHAFLVQLGAMALHRAGLSPPPPAAFWRLMAAAELLDNPAQERAWELILHGIALMTDGASGSVRSAHGGNMPVGRALSGGGALYRSSPFYSEDRLAHLLTARGDTFRAQLPGLFRMMSTTNVSFNWREMARLILSEECDPAQAELGRRRIARDYYRAEWRSSQSATPTPQGADSR